MLCTSQWTHKQPTGSDCLHSHGTTPHVKKIPLSRQLLKMGTWWHETCWATYKRRNKYNTKWHLVGFLFHIELRCTVNHTSNSFRIFSPFSSCFGITPFEVFGFTSIFYAVYFNRFSCRVVMKGDLGLMSFHFHSICSLAIYLKNMSNFVWNKTYLAPVIYSVSYRIVPTLPRTLGTPYDFRNTVQL